MPRDNSEDARSGWKSRRARGRNRGRTLGDRDEIRAARAALITGDETAFNPEVQTTAPAPGEDFVTALSDADLVALYKQLHDGKAPNGKAKRPAIERAVRAKQAERAAVEPVGADNTELTLDQLADETVEGDDV